MSKYSEEPCEGLEPSQGFVFTNATITDGHSFLIENAALLIQNGKFTFVGRTEDLPQVKGDRIDLKGRLVLPGLLNPHHHLYSALATGLTPKGPTTDFNQILENLWWHLDQQLDEESIYYSALYGLMQSARYGVTTVFDHHASMNAVGGSLKIIERAFCKLGLKGLLCYEISDRMGEAAVDSQIDENIAFWNDHKKNSRIKGLFGLHANFTLSEKTLGLIKARKPVDLPIHIHCGEDRIDWQYCIDQGYAGPVDRLNRFDLLSNKSFLAHCIHLSEKDYNLIREIQPVVISNPESNANNNVGIMDTGKIKKYLLGTDGMTGNILGTMRSHFLFRNGKINDPLGILFRYPADVIMRFFPNAGAIAKGKCADLAVTDYIPVTAINLDNLFYHLIFGVQGRPMYMTIVDGNIIYRNGEFQSIDEYEILNRAARAARQLHRKFNE